MTHPLTEPVRWQWRQWAVTGYGSYGIEALDGMDHVPVSEIPDADAGRPEWLESLRRRSGTGRNDLDAALKVGRALRGEGAGAKSAA